MQVEKYVCLIVLKNCIDMAIFTLSQVKTVTMMMADSHLLVCVVFTAGHHLTHQFLVEKESV